MQDYLLLKNISKSYNSLIALNDFNLSCSKGEIIVLLGENGSGKSTLISILSGTVKSNSGEIHINNKKVIIDCPQKSYKEKIACVFQHSTLIQEFSIIENMLLNKAWYKKKDTDKAIIRYKELSNFLEIDIDPFILVKDLSLGEQQIIELVRALWFEQEILLLDELTAHLTKQEVEKLENVLHKLAKNGSTILFITHKLDEAIRFADKIIVLQKGVKTLELQKDEMYTTQEELEKKLYNAMFSQEFLKDYPTRNNFVYDTQSFMKIENISTISNKQERGDIKDISFDIYEGEIIGIAGFEGHGQKKLAEALAGKLAILEGAIYLDNKNITNTNLQKRQDLGIFYVSNNRLEEEIAGEENIAINLQLKNMQDKNFFKFSHILWKNIIDFSKQCMQELAIPLKHAKTQIQYLSGGNMQKIIVKRALLQKHTRLVILHQPSYGIDLKTKKELHTQILKEAKNGCTFILISSDLDELFQLSNRVTFINQGSINTILPNNKDAYEKITYAFTNYNNK